jgi:hypothetical protein
MSLGKRVHVVLRDVPEVDEAGRSLLRRLAAAGCHLHASGVYNSHMVQTLQSAATKMGNPAGAGWPDTNGSRKN